jgi:hypothetical protein
LRPAWNSEASTDPSKFASYSVYLLGKLLDLLSEDANLLPQGPVLFEQEEDELAGRRVRGLPYIGRQRNLVPLCVLVGHLQVHAQPLRGDMENHARLGKNFLEPGKPDVLWSSGFLSLLMG